MRTHRRAAGLTAAALTATALVAAGPTATSTAAPTSPTTQAASGWFDRVATYPVFQNLPTGVAPTSQTVAEISAVTADGRTMIYTDAAGKRIGFLDLSDPAAPRGTGSVDLTQLGDASDEPTSVAVVGDYVLVVVDTSASFTNPSGRLDVIKISDRTRVRSIQLGGQPDSIAVSKDLKFAAIAIENQRDENATPSGGSKGDLPQAPAGFVQVVDLPSPSDPSGWTVTPVTLPSSALTGLTAPDDAEPEYVDINDANVLALTLQENNGVVFIDLATKAVLRSWSAGTVTLSGVDNTSDKVFNPTATITGVPREPDAIQWVGPDLVATANEGDWKGGSRGWTVFNATTGAVVWDAGTSFERIAVAHGLFNDARASKKGTEPEGLAFETFGGTPYAFVGSERSNFVAVYDMSDPTAPVFRQVLPTTNGPEGLLPVPSRNLLLTSSETDDASVGVRASVGVFRLGTSTPTFPSIVSTPTDGSAQPIGWTALGALSAAPGDPTHLWSASDSAASPGRLYSVDVSKSPAVIDRVVETTESGAPVALDIEAVSARSEGGFWLGSEGATGAANALVKVSATGVVQQRVSLPTAVSDRIKNWGIEGVAATGTGSAEQVYVALQRPLWVDPSVAAGAVQPVEGNNARIGRYDVATGAWTWFLYPLETTSTSGDWIGLSEITMVDSDTVAVIERDKLNGPAAAVKRVYTVDLPSTATGSVTPVTKRLAVDVLPTLRGLKGWTQEKLEGLTIGADRQVYAVTDNDGLKDATGETQFLRLGKATDVFSSALSSSTSLKLSATSMLLGGTATATVTVTPASSAASAGTVTLLDGGTPVATVKPSSTGVATFTFTPGLGSHSYTATWSGTDTRRPSTSSASTLVVGKVVTTTTLRADVGRKKVRLHATVTGATSGTVTFTSRGKVLGTATVRSGVATLVLKAKPGRRTVVASYAAHDSVLGSESNAVTVKVKKAKKRR
ncbi:esterase-like activity of phytase family protein [Nocardioides flavescens]|uniref:Alkaline phosphatase n=1 Tax=Nocardioides flavescens TaxID=2691959 RepID=A0A6L7EUF4_9ACTN|nr:esterase-like activity of phytase family protein [Nocardioides flavescens]MXG90330.1 alkaline phosphatase [Nocardioides flavescens]